MLYTVWYKKFFWRKIKNVKADGFVSIDPQNRIFVSTRFFILSDETRIEIPSNYQFRFSKERWIAIKKNMEETVGQPIVTK